MTRAASPVPSARSYGAKSTPTTVGGALAPGPGEQGPEGCASSRTSGPVVSGERSVDSNPRDSHEHERETPALRPDVDEVSARARRGGSPAQGPSSIEESGLVSGDRPRTTAPPPMSDEEYGALAKSSPRARAEFPESDRDSSPRSPLRPAFDLGPIEADDGGPNTRPPAGRRAESLAKLAAWRVGRANALTTPSRRASDQAGHYDFQVPRAPPLPALTLPNMPATRISSDAMMSTERPTPFGARAQLEDRTLVPRASTAGAALKDLALDHKAGFLLSLVDGKTTVEELLDMCPMPEEEALSALATLLVRGVITLAGPVSPRRPR